MQNENMIIPDDMEQAAKIAIAMEEEGYKIYTEAANKSKNPLGKATFTAIAEKELMHKREIEAYYKKIKGESLDSSKTVKSDILKEIRNSLAKITDLESDLISSYEIAMDMERTGYDFYKKISEKTTDSDAKKLFEFLAFEENIHYEIFQDTYLYLSNPSEWFEKEEKWLVEG